MYRFQVASAVPERYKQNKLDQSMVSWINRKGWPQPPTNQAPTNQKLTQKQVVVHSEMSVKGWCFNQFYTIYRVFCRIGSPPMDFLDESPHHPSHPHQTKQRNKETNKPTKILQQNCWTYILDDPKKPLIP